MILAGKSRGRRAYRPGLARAEFQKVHGRERCTDEKEFGITEVESHLSRLGIIWKRGRGIGSRKTTSNFCGEDPDLVGRNSREIIIAKRCAVGKEFGMAEGNFVTKNARPAMKKFATEM